MTTSRLDLSQSLSQFPTQPNPVMGGWRMLLGCLCATALLSCAQPLSAQVFIWSLPEVDGTQVKFQGTYKSNQARPRDMRGDLSLEWDTELTVKSVGEEMAEFKGKTETCRWLEFVSITKPHGQKPGPGGTRIYKVLVPASQITGALLDKDQQPNDSIPIVKGYRKLGEGMVSEVKEKALALNPLIVPVTYYRNLQAESEDPVTVTLPQIGDVQAVMKKGSVSLVSDTIRTTNTAELWLSTEVPFGLAKFKVVVLQEQKDDAQPEDQFQRNTTVEVEMSAVEKGTGATSDLTEK